MEQQQAQERLALPAAQWVVYQAAMESLTRAVEADKDPALVAELRTRCGYDLEHPRREYTPDNLVQVINFLVGRCFPGKTRNDAFEELGRRGFAAYRTTVAGRIVLASLKAMPLQKALRLFSQGIATATNFTVYEAVDSGPTSLTLQAHNSYSPPLYVIGMLKSMLDECGHPEVQIRLDERSYPKLVEYFLTW
jgi:uncharacterized protein (TIGR02265 family)